MQGTQTGTTFPNQAITAQPKGISALYLLISCCQRDKNSLEPAGQLSSLHPGLALPLLLPKPSLDLQPPLYSHCLGSVGRTKACFFTIPLVCIFQTEGIAQGEALDQDALPRCH